MSGQTPFFDTVGALAVLCHLLQGNFQLILQCTLYIPGYRNPAFCRGCEGRSLVGVDADPCRREAEVEVESAAVINEAWLPWNAFFVGWHRAGMLI